MPHVARPRRSALGASSAIALLSIVALAMVAGPVLAAGHAVAIRDSSFGPSSITIKAGDSITWTNRGTTQHNVTFSSFGSTTYMDPGTRYSHTFRTAGTFRYTCTLHGFTGKVVVTGAATPKPTPKPTKKPTPKPTAKATTAPAASPTTSPAAKPSTAAASGSPAGPTAVPALGAVGPSPSADGAPDAGADSGGSPAGSTGPAIVLLVGLVAAGVVGLGVLARRGR